MSAEREVVVKVNVQPGPDQVSGQARAQAEALQNVRPASEALQRQARGGGPSARIVLPAEVAQPLQQRSAAREEAIAQARALEQMTAAGMNRDESRDALLQARQGRERRRLLTDVAEARLTG